MTRPSILAALAFLASACATSELPPPPEVSRFLDPRAVALEQAVAAAAAKEGGAVARRTSLSVEGVEEVGDNLVFDLRVIRNASFGKDEREFNVVARCPAASPQICRDRVMAAIRAAAKTE